MQQNKTSLGAASDRPKQLGLVLLVLGVLASGSLAWFGFSSDEPVARVQAACDINACPEPSCGPGLVAQKTQAECCPACVPFPKKGEASASPQAIPCAETKC